MTTEHGATEHATTLCYDVVIVGAGLSGIGAAVHLQHKCPTKSYVILEGRDALGGTWDLFRYPGVRSDSDMYTLGYNFKPWLEAKSIADGPSILRYIVETAAENGIDRQIRCGHRVKTAIWSSSAATWTIEAERTETGETVRFRCNFLLMCAGYYSYDGGFTPSFKGSERFTGDIIHPQQWPEDLDYRGKQVVIIGSGATAMTLVPAMAGDAAHVVMLQRSPTYVVSIPAEDKLAKTLHRFLPTRIAYAITRWKNIKVQLTVYQRCRAEPERVKEKMIGWVGQALGPDYDVATHFVPRYNPWEQRLCFAPDGDLFKAIRSGRASVVTDLIDTFTETGIALKSGRELKTDIIITATGLNLAVLGGVAFIVDGRPVDFSKTYTYRGVMYSDIPNLVSTFGYVNASWTLRADLNAAYVCRLINHMDKLGVHQCTPRLRADELTMPTRPFIQGFSAGYVQRNLHLLPKQGDREPWVNPQDYRRDQKLLLRDPIDDGALVFDNDAVGDNR
ncbi:MAG: NAD(P)/FAD-dependent oxidoreductase [Anaerolineae bacterium]|nr:NAD(P)/FAD-dependent oxidoreductase [Anaerolineae bacterium]